MGIIKHNLSIEDAMDLVREALNGKIGILSTKENVFKVGSPMMAAKITVTDSEITIEGKLFAKPIANTCESSISLALKKNGKTSSSNNSGDSSLNEQIKTAELLKSIKELYDLGIISEDEYNSKRNELISNMDRNKNNISNGEDNRINDFNKEKYISKRENTIEINKEIDKSIVNTIYSNNISNDEEVVKINENKLESNDETIGKSIAVSKVFKFIKDKIITNNLLLITTMLLVVSIMYDWIICDILVNRLNSHFLYKLFSCFILLLEAWNIVVPTIMLILYKKLKNNLFVTIVLLTTSVLLALYVYVLSAYSFI